MFSIDDSGYKIYRFKRTSDSSFTIFQTRVTFRQVIGRPIFKKELFALAFGSLILLILFHTPMSSSQLPALGVLLLAKEIQLVKLWFVESCLLDRKESGCVLEGEPDPVSLVVDHPSSLLWRSNRVS